MMTVADEEKNLPKRLAEQIISLILVSNIYPLLLHKQSNTIEKAAFVTFIAFPYL